MLSVPFSYGVLEPLVMGTLTRKFADGYGARYCVPAVYVAVLLGIFWDEYGEQPGDFCYVSDRILPSVYVQPPYLNFFLYNIVIVIDIVSFIISVALDLFFLFAIGMSDARMESGSDLCKYPFMAIFSLVFTLFSLVIGVRLNLSVPNISCQIRAGGNAGGFQHCYFLESLEGTSNGAEAAESRAGELACAHACPCVEVHTSSRAARRNVGGWSSVSHG